MKLRTEFKFSLPERDEAGHKIKGVMKLLKVKDVMQVQRDRKGAGESSFKLPYFIKPCSRQPWRCQDGNHFYY